MTKKLTGREAVIALIEGRQVFRMGSFSNNQFHNTLTFYPDVGKIDCTFNRDSNDVKEWQLIHVLQYHDWKIVPEPMVWEGEEGVLCSEGYKQKFEGNASFMTLSLSYYVKVPETFANKRVKVRIEEIL
jgi:hypothetical protein